MMGSSQLAYLAVALVLVSATLHVALGVVGLYEAFALGTGSTAMAPLFLLAAALAYLFVLAYARGALSPARTYALGLFLMVAYLLAYAEWHAFGVVEATLDVDGVGHDHDHSHNDHDHSHDDDHGHGDHAHSHGEHDHSHDGSVAEILIDHLRADPFALISKTAEAGAAIVFTILYARER